MTWFETATWFGNEQSLFGIVSLPPGREGLPGVVLMNPGTLHRVGGARLNVRIARSVASRSLPSIRFDLSGLGDSEARSDGSSYRDSTIADLSAAMSELERLAGCTTFLLIGHCTGAAMSYQAALVDERIIGLVQLEGFAYRTPLYHYHKWKRILLNPANWAALLRGEKDLRPMLRRAIRNSFPARREPTAVQAVEAQSVAEARNQIRGLADLLPPRAEMRAGLAQLIARRVRMLHIYAGGEHHYYSYRQQFQDAFPGLDTACLLEVEHLPDADHYFSAPAHQAWLDSRLLAWAGRQQG